MKRPPILPLLLALAPLFAAGAGDPATNASAAGTDGVAVAGRRDASPACPRRGRELRVGPGETFSKPSDAAKAARDGDTVRIAAGE